MYRWNFRRIPLSWLWHYSTGPHLQTLPRNKPKIELQAILRRFDTWFERIEILNQHWDTYDVDNRRPVRERKLAKPVLHIALGVRAECILYQSSQVVFWEPPTAYGISLRCRQSIVFNIQSWPSALNFDWVARGSAVVSRLDADGVETAVVPLGIGAYGWDCAVVWGAVHGRGPNCINKISMETKISTLGKGQHE